MSKRIIWLLGITIVLLIGLGIRQFYISVQIDQWKLENELVATAKAKADLQEVSQAQYFYGEKTVGIVFGTNREGKEILVMLDADQIVKEVLMQDVYPIETLKQNLREQHPDAQILRVTPGTRLSNYVWEIYYKRINETETSYHYVYYNLETGKFVDTYQLSPRFP